MARLKWDSREHILGLDRGVFYPENAPGEAWNGLVSIVESPETNESTRYIDGVKTHYRRKYEEFSGTIEAHSYPYSFYEDVFVKKRMKSFGLSYRTTKKNGYDIHLVYNVSVAPSSNEYQQRDKASLSWSFTTRSIPIPGAKASSHLIVDTAKSYTSTISNLEDILYGTEVESPRLPTPQEVLEIFEENSILRVIDHGDGTFTVSGPDSAIEMIDSTTFQITWPSAVYIDEVSYRISSL